MIIIKCVMYCNYMTVCECRPLTGLFLIEGRSHVHSHSGASVSSSPRCEQATADASLPSLFYSSLNPFFPSYSSAVLTFSWNFLHSFAHFIILDGNIQASCTVKQTLQKSFRAVDAKRETLFTRKLRHSFETSKISTAKWRTTSAISLAMFSDNLRTAVVRHSTWTFIAPTHVPVNHPYLTPAGWSMSVSKWHFTPTPHISRHLSLENVCWRSPEVCTFFLYSYSSSVFMENKTLLEAGLWWIEADKGTGLKNAHFTHWRRILSDGEACGNCHILFFFIPGHIKQTNACFS